jgi:hypothetical protein
LRPMRPTTCFPCSSAGPRSILGRPTLFRDFQRARTL